MNTDSVDIALSDVKEYASRASEINVDTLQIKLMHLDEAARRAGHTNRELYSLALQRFLCHKQHPKIGFLITSLLSSPAEAKLFEKEQKFLKLHGKEQVKDNNVSENDDDKKPNAIDFQNAGYFMSTPPAPAFAYYPRFALPPPARQVARYRRGFGGGRARPWLGNEGCFKCGDPSHFQINCPRK